MKYFVHVHTRATKPKRWVCIARVDSKAQAEEHIQVCLGYADPMWRQAEYLIGTTLYPSTDVEGKTYETAQAET